MIEAKNSKKFYTLRNDIIFKNTFDTKKRLKRLLEETLNLKVNNIFKNNTELTVENIKKRKLIKCHIADDDTCEKLYDEIFEIVFINMDYFERVWYDGNIKKENPFLMLLAAPTEEKMDLISGRDKFMEELSDKVKRLNKDPDILDVIIEDENEIIANSMYEKGISQGIEKGINQTAKKLLKMNMSIEDIAKATGLSKKDIENLKKDI